MKKLFVMAVAVVGLAGCGGGGGSMTSPTQVIPSTAATVSGIDGTPVEATKEGTGPTLSVSAPGFLGLDTVDRGRTIYLWPNNSRVAINDTFQFVYAGNEFNPLTRLGDSTTRVSVVLHGELASDPQAAAAAAEGIAKDNDLLADAGVPLRFVTDGSGQVKVDVSIDPSDPVFASGNRPGAATYNTLQQSTGILLGARVVIHDLPQARMTLTVQHELVHTIGLGHSTHVGPMMIGAGVYQNQEFTDLDRDFVRLLFRRQPGTRISLGAARENDRGAVASSSNERVVRVVGCSL